MSAMTCFTGDGVHLATNVYKILASEIMADAVPMGCFLRYFETMQYDDK